MKEFSIPLKEKIKRIDPIILFCVIGMNIMSIVTLSAGADAWKAGAWYVRVQTLASVVSFLAMAVITFVDYDLICRKLKYPMVIAAVGLILFVMRFGKGESGNLNWITIPGTDISFQPTEFSKILMIMPFAMLIDKVKDKINHPLSILALGAYAGVMVLLVVKQGDDGMALVYFGILLIMVFSAGISLWYFAGGAAAVVLAAPLIWEKFLDKYQRDRILVGFNPDLDPIIVGWQSIASRECIIAGGFRGAGFTGGTKYFSLPAGQSDFLYAVLAEKFGFLGTFLYLTLVVILILRILWIARDTRKNYASYICVGIAAMILVQATVNIGMCLAVLPVVGLTCPFLSYGPSSILSMYLAIGIVQSICTHKQKYYFEREPE